MISNLFKIFSINKIIFLHFKAIEVYLCDIRPVDRDLNWSIASKLFVTEKLSKAKKFFAKIQLAACNLRNQY
jgi:hypothetical protein